MTDSDTRRIALVLDGTGAAAEQHARALGGFLHDGMHLPDGVQAEAVTHLFYASEDDRERLIALAPSRDVRLVRTPPHRPDVMAAALAAFEAGGGAELFVFPDGPLGAELAARLAARAGGGVITDVLDVDLTGGLLACRRSVYSGHLTGRFELRTKPWCVCLDAGWPDSRPWPAPAHVVQADAGVSGRDVSPSSPLRDFTPLEPPGTGDLAAARALVVAGRGARGPDGVARIRTAAARLGAAFGVTRPVVMNGWASPDRQIGVSGTCTAPAVCIVAGASGAPAFLRGVERAAFIAAVDTDEHAAIAGEADAVVFDDAVAILEALAELFGQPPA